jgi:hypothetical protein
MPGQGGPQQWSSPGPYSDIIWNPEPGGNVEHIAEQDLTPEEVEAVLLHPVAHDISRSSGRPMVYGFTPDGRYIVVVYEEMDHVCVRSL